MFLSLIKFKIRLDGAASTRQRKDRDGIKNSPDSLLAQVLCLERTKGWVFPWALCWAVGGSHSYLQFGHEVSWKLTSGSFCRELWVIGPRVEILTVEGTLVSLVGDSVNGQWQWRKGKWNRVAFFLGWYENWAIIICDKSSDDLNQMGRLSLLIW